MRKPTAAGERLIVALDFPHATEARKAIAAIGGVARMFKVGKQLFTAEGPAFVRELAGQNCKIFLDLKYHDIPNTVAGAASAAGELGVAMLTVHAAGGAKMLEAAANAAGKSKSPPLVLAVTVLTSLDDADLHSLGINGSAMEQVLRLTALAQRSGCDGVVASAREAEAVRRECGRNFVIVTPGVRPAGSAANDQARTVTPAQAVAAGADYIVMGRPITAAADPAAAARAAISEMAKHFA